MDLAFIPSGSVLFTANADDSNGIEKAVPDLLADVSPFLLSSSHAVTFLSPAGSDDDRPMVVGQNLTYFTVTSNAGAAPPVDAGTVSSEAKFTSDTRFTLMTNQPSAVAASNQTAESTSPPKSASGGGNHSGSQKKHFVMRAPKAIRKPEKTVHRKKSVFFVKDLDKDFNPHSCVFDDWSVYRGLVNS